MTQMGARGTEQGFALGFTRIAQVLGRYDGTEENAQQLCDLVALPKGSRVLDVACGGGRYAAALHRLGHRVTGFDLSPEQIAYAREHNPGPQYLVGDMRDPPGGDYDLILVAYSGFGLLDSEAEDRSALARWHAKLKVGGRLAMEVSDLERAEHRYGRSGRAVTFDDGDKHEIYTMDWDNNILTVTHGVDGIGFFTCRRRVYARAQISQMLEDTGFNDIRIYGSFAGGEKRPQDRAVFLARRS